jgi:hypothetical protein
LFRNCLLKDVIKGNISRNKGRRGRRRKQLQNDVKENRELEIESTTSYRVENSTGKFLCGRRMTDYVMDDYA